MSALTISKRITGGNELVVISRSEYERFLRVMTNRKKGPTAADVIRWSREAKKLKRAGRLPTLRSLKNFR